MLLDTRLQPIIKHLSAVEELVHRLQMTEMAELLSFLVILHDVAKPIIFSLDPRHFGLETRNVILLAFSALPRTLSILLEPPLPWVSGHASINAWVAPRPPLPLRLPQVFRVLGIIDLRIIRIAPIRVEHIAVFITVLIFEVVLRALVMVVADFCFDPVLIGGSFYLFALLHSDWVRADAISLLKLLRLLRLLKSYLFVYFFVFSPTAFALSSRFSFDKLGLFYMIGNLLHKFIWLPHWSCLRNITMHSTRWLRHMWLIASYHIIN